MILLIFLPGKVCAEIRILSDAELDGIAAGTIAEDVLTGMDALTPVAGRGGRGTAGRAGFFVGLIGPLDRGLIQRSSSGPR